ncbi:MAG: septation protein SpoVG family protein [Candidatus Omnitrophica bacterium]|nr:septation protein SpoVG family protein [Candidatus Omnitrophota bacterium]
MDITEVRIFKRNSEDKKLKAFATITFDNCFVVRNIKVIEGNKGLFVAMPSRKIKEACPKCAFKNPARSKYCGQCATAMPAAPPPATSDDRNQRQSEHRDIAHPITAECREMIQKKVLEAYEVEEDSPAVQRPAPEATPSHKPPEATPSQEPSEATPSHEPFDATDVDVG